jgi:hypothetical protein
MDLSPVALKQLTDLVSTVGVLGLVIVALWSIYSGRVITKTAHEKALSDAEKKEAAVTAQRDALARQHAEQLAYIEARRKEEQERRKEAEDRLAALTESFERLTTVLQSIKDELIRGSRPEQHHV